LAYWHHDLEHYGAYIAPTGLKDETCAHIFLRRERVGPTSRKKSWMVLVDTCYRCGRHGRSAEDLTWPQYVWLRRWNSRVGQS